MDGLIQQLNRDKLTVSLNSLSEGEFRLECYFMQCCSSFSANAEKQQPPLQRKPTELRPVQPCRALQEFSKSARLQGRVWAELCAWCKPVTLR